MARGRWRLECWAVAGSVSWAALACSGKQTGDEGQNHKQPQSIVENHHAPAMVPVGPQSLPAPEPSGCSDEPTVRSWDAATTDGETSLPDAAGLVTLSREEDCEP